MAVQNMLVKIVIFYMQNMAVQKMIVETIIFCM